jgi:cysteine desulfurase
MRPIDLDQNATSPLDPAVLESMRPYWFSGGNPESRHGAGRAARRGWEQARQTVAEILGAEPGQVVFTSGGTEANNLGVLGLAVTMDPPGHGVASSIEHPAVAEPIARLMTRGWSLTRVPPRRDGITDTATFLASFRPDTRFATLMLAHNETGAVQPVAEIAHAADKRGIALHTDAVQAVGRIPVHFHQLGVTTLAASAHKFHGPSGIGVLLVRPGARLEPLFVGGGQQQGLRPGTPPVALAVGFAAALQRWQAEEPERTVRMRQLRDRLEAGITAGVGRDHVVRHGPTEEARRLPQTLYLGFPDLDANALLMQLDLAGVYASLGAACASGSTRASSTLLAMGVQESVARASIRFSLGAFTTADDIDQAINRLVRVVLRIRESTGPG